MARIEKVRGRRGEVAAQLWTDFPDRFQPGQPFWLSTQETPEAFFLEESWFHKGRVILKFRGVDSISAAEPLVGRWVLVPASERRPLPPGSVYLSDLVGCRVVEGERSLGTVETIDETGGVPLLRVRTAGGELLIPFAREICSSVAVDRKEIRVRLPEGLEALNREKRFAEERSAEKRFEGQRGPRPRRQPRPAVPGARPGGHRSKRVESDDD